MKKFAALILSAMFVLGLTSTAMANSTQVFTDVKVGDWFYQDVMTMFNKKAIEGYPDGSFKPNDDITNAEFVKIVVGSTLGKQVNAPTDKHWAANYMEVAFENKLIDKTLYQGKAWDKPIIRQEMAMIVAKTLTNVLKESKITDTYLYTGKIKDWTTICETCKPYIAQAYAKGIVNGNPDGSFKGTNKATRAEAITMLVRLIMPDKRIEVAKVEEKPSRPTPQPQPPSKTPEEIQKELNDLVEKGMVTVSMNLSPVFDSGKSEGNLLIKNKNKLDQQVKIYREDTKELIYESPIMPNNGGVDKAKLAVALAKGKYKCVAYFYVLDNKEVVGKVGANILVTINS